MAASAVLAMVGGAFALATGVAAPAEAASCNVTFPGKVTPSVSYPATGSNRLSLKPPSATPNQVVQPICGNPRVMDIEFTTPYVQPNELGFLGPKVPRPRIRVIVPTGYNPASAAKSYSVLYLLHGGGVAPDAGYTDWTHGDIDPPSDAVGTSPDAVKKMAELGHAYSVVQGNTAANSGLIVVMVEGAALGQYADWYTATSTGQLSPRYKSWIGTQLVQWVDANFRTKGTPQSRAIAGYSMGGMGALNLARQTGLFKTVASFSGVTDIQDDGSTPFGHVSPGYVLGTGMQIWDGSDPGQIFGPTWQGGLVNQGSGPGWDEYNPVKHASELAGKDVWISAGVNNPAAAWNSAARCDQGTLDGAVESSICVVNQNLNKKISDLPAASRPSPYLFVQAPGNVHSFVNWNARLTTWLSHAMAVLPAP